MMLKTAPTAQILKEKAKPLAEAVGTRMEATKVRQLLNRPKQNDQQQRQQQTAMLVNAERNQPLGVVAKQLNCDNATATITAQQQRYPNCTKNKFSVKI